MLATWKLYAVAFCVIAGLFLVWRIMLLSGCQTAKQKNREERREERSKRSKLCEVVQVWSGAQLEVEWLRRKTKVLALQGIEVPPSVVAESCEHLRTLVCKNEIRVDYETHRLFSAGDNEAALEVMEVQVMEPIVGMVYGDGNVCLNVEQLRAGLARCTEGATSEMKAAEKAAKKSKIGVWK
jgi:endonuclease YncB( thermonuclease family)